MFRNTWLRGGLLLGALLLTTVASAQDGKKNGQTKAKKAERPRVEVVFCLDTTGSMSGLINAAKQKIWAISNQIAAGTPTPDVRIGLVAYRDRGDDYITKVVDLTDDLDGIHRQLMGFQAQGGGDFPESVNQALHESVTKITWNKDKKTLRLIFLVGDAPPHMDYQEIQYPEICKLAVKNDIIINTVQCGNNSDTRKYWTEICRLAEGSYVQIDQEGGPVVVTKTPFDADLAKINTELARTTVTYGSQARQQVGELQKKEAEKLSAPAAADRAGFYANSGRGASYDLLENIKQKRVKLEDLKPAELPPELKGKNLEQQKAFLEQLERTRTELNQRAQDLDRKRRAYITYKEAEELQNRDRDSFDSRVLSILQTQANRVNIRYAAPATEKGKK